MLLVIHIANSTASILLFDYMTATYGLVSGSDEQNTFFFFVQMQHMVLTAQQTR